jgi:hypothetical protein
MHKQLAYVPLAVLSLALCSLDASASPATRYWLAPAPDAPGGLELFTKLDAWPQSRALVQVFQFFSGAVLDDGPYCDSCDQINYANLTARNAFGQLQSWGMKLSFEVGSLKGGTPGRCDGTDLAQEAIRILQRVQAAGSRVDYFAMDNPSMSGLLECGLNEDQVGQVVANYTQTVQAEFARLYPGQERLKFILVDGYAGLGYSAAHMIQLTDAMLAHGAQIDGFHPDLDLRAVKGRKEGDSILKGEIEKLMSYAKAHGMEFGFLMTGMNGASDQAYHDETLKWVRKFRWLFGAPTYDGVLESWDFHKNPDGSTTWVPSALSETDPYSHTKLLLDIDATLHRDVSWFEVLLDGFWVPW